MKIRKNTTLDQETIDRINWLIEKKHALNEGHALDKGIEVLFKGINSPTQELQYSKTSADLIIKLLPDIKDHSHAINIALISFASYIQKNALFGRSSPSTDDDLPVIIREDA